MPERVLPPGSAAPGESDLEEVTPSAVPQGFEVLRSRAGRSGSSPGRLLILRSNSRESLLSAGVVDPVQLATGELVTGHLAGGRARHAVVRYRGEEWVVKTYRRGGVLGKLNSQRYWGSGRFLQELRLANAAEAAGVPTAEILALILEPAGLGSLRAWLVTRYLRGSLPLDQAFGNPPDALLFHEAGRVVRRMHLAGIDHRDLHLGNIMGERSGDLARVHVVDWDLACLRSRDTWNPCSNLSRLWRSLEKARRKRPLPGFGRALRAFLRGYFAHAPADLRAARVYFRRRTFLLGLHRWFWRSEK